MPTTPSTRASTMVMLNVQSFLVSIAGRKEHFVKADWGGMTWKSEKSNDGESLTMSSVRGMGDCENITLEKPYDPVSDPDLVSWIRGYCSDPITITVTPQHLCPTGGEWGASWTLLNCFPTKIKLPNVDRNGSGVAMLTLEFNVGDFQMGASTLSAGRVNV